MNTQKSLTRLQSLPTFNYIKCDWIYSPHLQLKTCHLGAHPINQPKGAISGLLERPILRTKILIIRWKPYNLIKCEVIKRWNHLYSKK